MSKETEESHIHDDVECEGDVCTVRKKEHKHVEKEIPKESEKTEDESAVRDVVLPEKVEQPTKSCSGSGCKHCG